MYDGLSGQLINKNKSHFIMHSNGFKRSVDRVKLLTGLLQKKAPFTYLGCLLYFGRQRIIYFLDLVSKVVSRISGWQSKLLSYGGTTTLIKHMLQSLPIHILSVASSHSTTLKKIQCIIEDFFWAVLIKKGSITGPLGGILAILMKKRDWC